MASDKEVAEQRAVRLELALAHARMSAAAAARSIGISSASLAQMKAGRHFAEERWIQIAEKTGVPAKWLIYESGPAPSWAEPWKMNADPVPSWAAELLHEVKALRDEVAEMRRQSAQPDHDRRREGVETRGDVEQFIAGHARDDLAGDDLDRLQDPDEHPRPKAPTYPRPSPIPGGPPRGH